MKKKIFFISLAAALVVNIVFLILPHSLSNVENNLEETIKVKEGSTIELKILKTNEQNPESKEAEEDK